MLVTTFKDFDPNVHPDKSRGWTVPQRPGLDVIHFGDKSRAVNTYATSGVLVSGLLPAPQEREARPTW